MPNDLSSIYGTSSIMDAKNNPMAHEGMASIQLSDNDAQMTAFGAENDDRDYNMFPSSDSNMAPYNMSTDRFEMDHAKIAMNQLPLRELVKQMLDELLHQTGYIEIHKKGLEQYNPQYSMTGEMNINVENESGDVFTLTRERGYFDDLLVLLRLKDQESTKSRIDDQMISIYNNESIRDFNDPSFQYTNKSSMKKSDDDDDIIGLVYLNDDGRGHTIDDPRKELESIIEFLTQLDLKKVVIGDMAMGNQRTINDNEINLEHDLTPKPDIDPMPSNQMGKKAGEMVNPMFMHMDKKMYGDHAYKKAQKNKIEYYQRVTQAMDQQQNMEQYGGDHAYEMQDKSTNKLSQFFSSLFKPKRDDGMTPITNKKNITKYIIPSIVLLIIFGIAIAIGVITWKKRDSIKSFLTKKKSYEQTMNNSLPEYLKNSFVYETSPLYQNDFLKL